MNENFFKAIHQKLIVKIIFDSKEKGIIERHCVPFDFGPSRKFKDGANRYHFFDLDSPEGKHTLSILPDQIISIDIISMNFDPVQYVKWEPKWFVKRDWGIYS